MTDPYREPAAAPKGPRVYFVRSADGSDEKGPYTLDAIRAGVARSTIRESAAVRESTSTEIQTVFELLRGIKRRPATTAADAARFKRDAVEREKAEAAKMPRWHLTMGTALLVVGATGIAGVIAFHVELRPRGIAAIVAIALAGLVLLLRGLRGIAAQRRNG